MGGSKWIVVVGIAIAGSAAACSVKAATYSPEDAGAGDGNTRSYTVTVETEGSGTGMIVSTPPGIVCPGQCAMSVPDNTAVALTATADRFSTFAAWGGACAGTADCLVTMDGAKSVTASFALRQFQLSVTRGGSGSGTVTSNTGINCGGACSQTLDARREVTLTAAASAGSLFTGWTGDRCGGLEPCTVTMDSAISVGATFQRAFSLSVTKSGAGVGTVTSNPAGISCGADCSEAFVSGTAVSLTAEPAPGSTFAGWSGACSGTGPCDVTMNANAQVTASFNGSGTLFVIEENNNRLVRFSIDTLTATDVGSLAIDVNLGDLAWHAGQSAMYLVPGSPEDNPRTPMGLYRVNLVNGTATLVGAPNNQQFFAIAYHPPSDQLYGIARDSPSDRLYRIDTATGALTVVGLTGLVQAEGLAWDSTRNMMVAYAVQSPRGVVAIDVRTGMTTMPLSSENLTNGGLTYDPRIDRFWYVTFGGQLFQLDPLDNYVRRAISAIAGRLSGAALILPTAQ